MTDCKRLITGHFFDRTVALSGVLRLDPGCDTRLAKARAVTEGLSFCANRARFIQPLEY